MNWTCREIPFGSPDYRASLVLREEVLRKPLGLPLREEDFAGEAESFHLGCYGDDIASLPHTDRREPIPPKKLVGCLVLKPVDETTLRMRQVAIAPETQGRGAGSDLIAFAETFARDKGYRMIVAHAREPVVPFYLKRGYSLRSGRFIEVTIPHFAIAKEIATSANGPAGARPSN